jgi:hypothetical protein
MKSGSRVYVELDMDLDVVYEFLEGTGPVEIVVDRLALRSASQIEALKDAIQARRNDASLEFEARLKSIGGGWWTAALQYPTMGLLLGPIDFDLWLLDQVMTYSSSEMG